MRKCEEETSAANLNGVSTAPFLSKKMWSGGKGKQCSEDLQHHSANGSVYREKKIGKEREKNIKSMVSLKENKRVAGGV